MKKAPFNISPEAHMSSIRCFYFKNIILSVHASCVFFQETCKGHLKCLIVHWNALDNFHLIETMTLSLTLASWP